jgi:hypothetical protein
MTLFLCWTCPKANFVVSIQSILTANRMDFKEKKEIVN